MISGSKDVGTNKLNFIRLFDSTSSHNIQNLQRDFIANASHELKTPVSVIIGYCETLLNDNKADTKVKEKFKQWLKKPQECLRLLMTYYRLELKELSTHHQVKQLNWKNIPRS